MSIDNQDKMMTDKDLIKQLEERLKGTSDLQSRITELTEKLYAVNKKLKEAEISKGHFISNITNEIINPFASILALSENIQKLKDGEIQKAKEMATLINSEAFHLDFQLKNIFAAATIESGKEAITVSSFNLKELLNQVIEYFKKQIESRHIQIDFSIDGEENCVSDYAKVDLVVKNLLSNAIKFSHAGGKVNIEVIVNDQSVELIFRDFGKGIPEEHREQIFDRFMQVDERINSINSGHGLGLSIVKSYCLLLNGNLEMQFPADGGTRVVVSLPVSDMVDDDLSDFIIDSGEKF